MASYSITTAAIALGVDRKRLENLLLRVPIPETRPGRQGRARRLGRTSLLFLATLVELQERLGIPAAIAAEVAGGLLTAGSSGVHRGPIRVAADVRQLETGLTDRLAIALEMAPRPRRGRPRTGPAS